MICLRIGFRIWPTKMMFILLNITKTSGFLVVLPNELVQAVVKMVVYIKIKENLILKKSFRKCVRYIFIISLL